MEARTIRIGVESVWGKLTAILERVKQKLFGRSIFANAALGDTYITDDMATAISRWAMLYSNKAPWLAKNSHGMGLPAAIAREVATLVTLEMNVEVTDPNHSSDQMNGQCDIHQRCIRRHSSADASPSRVCLRLGRHGFKFHTSQTAR